MIEVSRLSAVGFAMGLFFCFNPPSSFAQPVQPAEEGLHAHEEALQVETEDPVLKEQIVKVGEAIGQLHEQMAQKRRAIQAAADQAEKSTLYAELDVLRKEHDMLEGLLHELVEEARATEWTKVDEALSRVEEIRRRREYEERREEVLRDRQL